MNLDFINGQTVGILVFFIGLYGLMTKKNIVKTIMSMSVMEAGIYLFYISINFADGSVPPIGQEQVRESITADPVPQALMITAIVIGIGVTAIGLTMFMHYKQKHGITHWSRINREEGGD